MQLFRHFHAYPWRVPLYCLPVAILGGVTEVAYLFDHTPLAIRLLLLVFGLALLVGLAGYVVAIRSILKSDHNSKGVEAFFLIVLAITHVLGTSWYWFVCAAFWADPLH
jgi:hypothetical protein